MREHTSLVLKRDGRGRVRTPRAQREALLIEFDRSGLSAARFAALAGVKYQTFCHWVQKHRAGHPSVASKAGPLGAAVFMEAVTADCGGAVLRLRLPGGCEAEIADVRQAVIAATLVRELGKGGASC